MARLTKGRTNLDFYVDLLGNVTIEQKEITLPQDSEIILLDEPTTFLDMAYQIEVLDLLHELNVERSKTIVMVVHDLNHACRYADYLVAVRAGRINAQGEPSRVVTESLVREVFGIACRIIPDPVTNMPLVVQVSKVEKRKPRDPSLNCKHPQPI